MHCLEVTSQLWRIQQSESIDFLKNGQEKTQKSEKATYGE